MNEIKSYVLAHKKIFLTAAAALAAVGIAAAFLCTAIIKGPDSGAGVIPEGRIHDAGVFGEEVEIYDSANGEIVIDGSATPIVSPQLTTAASDSKLIADPDGIWTKETYAGNHTPVEAAQMEDGSLGVLTIEKLGVSVNVFESPDQMEAMTKGVAHFSSTSAWDGNIGLSAHNVNFDGSDGYFKNLYALSEGDVIQYKTALGERSYTVKSVGEIDASDWSTLGYTDENQLTLITCISGKPEKRLCVQAAE
ncbi:class D sortase [Yanshouia hominis]|uniref:Class D sortase n=1 Tax=Yanshouia hominis TaxID=2763673 RepID=A0ABR7NLN4_9FIRM|nr:class D sortase [Yanshouia hominis]MBC8577316.1 class D sortase [Yanshouia hominis]